jgi:hypothetical protein
MLHRAGKASTRRRPVNSALGSKHFVSRSSGRIYLRNMDGGVDDDFPEDIEDGTKYLAVPHKNDLDLGRDLVFSFINATAPDLHEQVHEIFRKKGAYSRFKDLLQRRRLLEHWHDYERAETREALAQWATENGLNTERDA